MIFCPLARWTLVSATLPLVDSPGDAELIAAVRGGDADAYGELFSRHVEAARRLGRQLVSGPDVDDLVAEAFAKVFVVLRRGGGPDLAFRAYLLTAVRRLHVDRIRAASRLHTTDDLSPFDAGVPFRDTAVEGFENATAARAFASLPERWQLVLWHTEVEGQKPADVGLLLGMSANSVSALAYRAREGLRQAFLSMHVRETEGHACTLTRERLGPYLRDGVSRRDRSRIEAHLQECRRCAAVYLELGEVNANLSGLLAPVLLGGAAAAYVASSGSRDLRWPGGPGRPGARAGADARTRHRRGGGRCGRPRRGRPVPRPAGTRAGPATRPRGKRAPATSASSRPRSATGRRTGRNAATAGPPRPPRARGAAPPPVRPGPPGARPRARPLPRGPHRSRRRRRRRRPLPRLLRRRRLLRTGAGAASRPPPNRRARPRHRASPAGPTAPRGRTEPGPLQERSSPTRTVLEASVTARPTPETSVTVRARATVSPPVRPDGPARPDGVAVEERAAGSAVRVTVTPGRDR